VRKFRNTSLAGIAFKCKNINEINYYELLNESNEIGKLMIHDFKSSKFGVSML
jgi:hypothetical protein